MSCTNVKDSIEQALVHMSTRGRGLATGFDQLDEITFGLYPQELIIIAGRPSMGKSSIMVDLCRTMGATYPMLMFSLEMSEQIVMQRLIANLAEIPYRRLITTKDLDEAEKARLAKAIVKIKNRNIIIDDASLTTPAQIREKCTKFRQSVEDTPFVVMVDYLQLLMPSQRTGARYTDIDAMVRELRSVAKDLNCIMVVLAQLNREVDNRKDPTPRLADLRESGGIEQMADMVFLLHRPSYYKMREINVQHEDDGEAYLIIAKNKQGPTGKLPVVWIPEFMAFRSIGCLADEPMPFEHADPLPEPIREPVGQKAPPEQPQESPPESTQEHPDGFATAEETSANNFAAKYGMPHDTPTGAEHLPDQGVNYTTPPPDDEIPF